MSDEMDEIWILYADDGAQAMDAMEAALLAIQDAQSADQSAQVAALFRAVHTFKGNARVLGLETVETRAHLAEDLIGLVRDRNVPFDAEILSLLLETGDRLREMLDETARTRADSDPSATEGLVNRLQEKIARCLSVLDGASPAVSLAVDAALPITVPEPAPVAHLPAAEEPAPADAPVTPALDPAPKLIAPATVSAGANTSSKLAADPTYRAIFNDMVSEAIADLRKAASQQDTARVKPVIKRIKHAAGQLGLQDWLETLSALPEQIGVMDIGGIIDTLNLLHGAQSPAAAAAPSEVSQHGFFSDISAPLSVISETGLSFSTGGALDLNALSAAVDQVCAVAEAMGYVRVISAARTLPAATDVTTFRHSELRLYEELASVEAALPGAELSETLSPRKLLQKWSADHVFETLDDLDQTLEQLRSATNSNALYRKLERMIRLVQLACAHFQLDVASDLSMTLLDLFSRSHMRGERPDAILMQIARGFVDTLELVFDAMREGETPDTERLEQLFREAADAGFVGVGAATAASIERRLGLPKTFHRVLSPESTRAASLAIERGSKFYILRADINTDTALAEGLFDLIGSGRIEALTNVTVFDGDRTIFDFLIATALDEVRMAEAIAILDPTGRKLVLLQTLNPAGESQEKADPSVIVDPFSEITTAPEISQKLIEQLGEVAAGQAMLQNMLGDLSETDLSETLEGLCRQHAHDPRAMRQAIRQVGDQWTEQLRELSQLGTQILGHLSELQQVTGAMRQRPAASLLNPMVAFVATLARSNGFDASLTTVGGEEEIDVTMLTTLRNAVQGYLQQRMSQPVHAPRRLHMTIRRQNEVVALTLDEDGKSIPTRELLAEVESHLQPHSGSAKLIQTPEGRHRLHLFLPVSMVVVEGMVVSAHQTRYIIPVGAIRTILQPDPSALLRVSAGGSENLWLRLNANEIIPVRDVSKARSATIGAAKTLSASQIFVVVSVAQSCVALPVDELLGQQLILSRPLRGVMAGLSGLSGVALLSRGDVAMVISPDSLCRPQALAG